MIADPRWFKTIKFSPDESVNPCFVGRTLTSLTCNVGALSAGDMKAFVLHSELKIHKAGRLVLHYPLSTLVEAGPGGLKLPRPLKLTATTRVSIETERGIKTWAPVVVSLGGNFLREDKP